jgi:exodeoxyribonuclease V alpha subunit
VVIVGQRKAMGIAVRGGQSLRRWSKLREWLAVDGTRPGGASDGGWPAGRR